MANPGQNPRQNPKKNEEPLFEEPKFDKRQYLTYERERAKAIISVFITGALIGLLSGELEIYGYWYISIILIIVVIYFLRSIITLFKIAIPKQTSHKLLMYLELIITWLVFWIIALNPPLHVVSGPEVIDLEYMHNGNWTKLNETNKQYDLLGGHSFQLRYYTEYKYNITNITIQENGKAISNTYDRSTGYVYFNLTMPTAGSTESININETSTVTTHETIQFFGIS
ncbi:hypothetical protein [Ferroplasma acidiphilum]|jgi:hypothetical protein|uniref:hypothetical protein n=1 Tax=Ferroplasma acidiphilum TaxID=74969 RepID=UPI0023F34598|nr:hypothetical protein [Ferroplasma acidiphilum]MCL4349241.1 hypothetical protein [Candidatus Thermoplasmatota archaeon]WMT52942.1 MAG: hypothetical protein RE473_07990 [Ferroplasma acidiphilum]